MKKSVCVMGFFVVVALGADSAWRSWQNQVDARLSALEQKVGIEPVTHSDGSMIGDEFGWSREQQVLFDRIMTKHSVDAATINWMGSSRIRRPKTVGIPNSLNDGERRLWESMVQKRQLVTEP